MSVSTSARHLLKSLAVESAAFRSFFSLQRSQTWTVKRLKQLQERRLRLTLKHAYNFVPYYRRLFRDRNMKPQDLRLLEHLNRLPILTKDEIKQHFDQFRALDSQKYWPIATATGGSTGEPLRFFIDVRSAGVGAAALWRGWSYGGYRPGDKMAVLAGLSLVSETGNLLKATVKKVIRRTAGFPAVSLRKEILKVYAEKIVDFKPRFIRGYPSSIYFFADFLREEGIDGICPRAVLTTAEMLLQHQRELIEQVFHCDVLDGYGAFDGGTAAFECEEHSGYHLAVEKAVIEFVDEYGDPVSEGETGRIIATDLFNYAMPFLRYETGDLGVFSAEECPCGRKLPLMKKILGRTTDILRFKNGAVLSGPSLTLIFKDFDIKQYQVVQTSDYSMVVKIVEGNTYCRKDTQKIYQVLKNAAGDEVDVKFEFVDHIQPTRSGKWKVVVSQAK